MIQLNYRDSKPIYEQVKDGFRRLIVQGVMEVDEKLPSVREMASNLAINPNTIQRAYRELEQEGYLYAVAGRGSFVAGVPEADSARKEELFAAFDAAVEELLYLQVEEREICQRVAEKYRKLQDKAKSKARSAEAAD